MSPEEVLNELHIRLVEVCKANDWNMIQTSVLPECKRLLLFGRERISERRY